MKRNKGRVRRAIELLLLRLFRLQGSTESIARGIGLGLFVAFTPTIGVQMIVSIVLCLPFGASKIASVLMCWITNPLTAVPIYSFNFLIGKLLISSDLDFQAKHLMSWEKFLAAGTEFAIVLWTGSLIVATALGIAGYFGAKRHYEPFRKRYLDQVLAKLKARRNKAETK